MNATKTDRKPLRSLTAIRLSPAELEAIDKLAAQHDLKRSEYMRRAALGTLPDPAGTLKRLEAIERRLDSLETA